MKVQVARESEVETDCSDCTKKRADDRLLQTLHPAERVMERACESCILKTEIEQGVEPENISFEPVFEEEQPTRLPETNNSTGDDESNVSRPGERRGSHTPATERYDLSEIIGNNMLLRFKLTPTVFDLDDNALQEKVEIITGYWSNIGDRDLCELLFTDFDPRMQGDWDRERYRKVQGMRNRNT
jgi:hypothetical protein